MQTLPVSGHRKMGISLFTNSVVQTKKVLSHETHSYGSKIKDSGNTVAKNRTDSGFLNIFFLPRILWG